MSLGIAQRLPDGAVIVCDGMEKKIAGDGPDFEVSARRIYQLTPSVFAAHLGVCQVADLTAERIAGQDLSGLSLSQLQTALERAVWGTWEEWLSDFGSGIPVDNPFMVSAFVIGGFVREPLIMRVACGRDPATGQTARMPTEIGMDHGQIIVLTVDDESDGLMRQNLGAAVAGIQYTNDGPRNAYLDAFLDQAVATIRHLATRNDEIGGRISWAVIRKGRPVETGDDE